jgi:gliding motility-associated-like protein
MIVARQYVLPYNQILYSAKKTPDGGVVAVGITQSPNGDNDAYLLKTDGQLRLSNPLSNQTGCTVIDFTPGIVQPVITTSPYTPIPTDLPLTTIDYMATATPFVEPTKDFCSDPAACTALTIAGKDSACNAKDTLLFKAVRQAGCNMPLQWAIDPSYATIIQATDSSVSLRCLKAGDVMLHGSMINRCDTLQDSLRIHIPVVPDTINLGPDMALCSQSTIRLSAGSGFASYVWQNGSVDSTLTAYLPGDYFVTAKDYCGHAYSDTIHITTGVAAPFDLGADKQICPKDSVTLSAPAGFSHYYWSPAYGIDNPYAQTVSVSPAVDTVYVCTAFQSPGCMVTDSIRVNVISTAQVHLGGDTSFCPDKSLVLDAGMGFVSYTWSTGATDQTITVTQPGIYWVSTGTAEQCISTDTVRVDLKDCRQGIFFPNAFAPNGNGTNTVYRPLIFGPLPEKYSFVIYNRLGENVFATTNPADGWDGKVAGMAQGGNTFVWFCRYTFAGQKEKTEKGVVILLR